METTKPSREELFILIWELPTTEVAKELEISDVALGKLCRRLQVPKPPRGYWARVQAGQGPKKPALAAFREELENRFAGSDDRRNSKAFIKLSPGQTEFLNRALQELASDGHDISECDLAHDGIRSIGSDLAAQILILIQHRFEVWVRGEGESIQRLEGARRRVGNLFIKLLPSAKEHAGLIHHLPTTYLSSRSKCELCISEQEIWFQCIMESMWGEDQFQTEKTQISQLIPVGLLSVVEKNIPTTIRSGSIQPYKKRLNALLDADRAFEIISEAVFRVDSAVLRRSGGRCELCGISSRETQIDVDHIIPRAKGGTNDISNLQALCRTCNAQKRDRDDTNFIEVHKSYQDREPGCIFCEAESRVIHENELAFITEDGYPVTEGHSLIIPKRHVDDYFDLYRSETNAIDELLRHQKNELTKSDPTITGFNIGINSGESAGQTVFHCHIHLVPRREGDVKDPRGGVRHVIPDKGYY